MSDLRAPGARVCLVLLEGVDGVFDSNTAAAVTQRLRVAIGDSFDIVGIKNRPSGADVERIADLCDRKSINRVIIAGCRLATANDFTQRIVAQSGLPKVYIRHVRIPFTEGSASSTAGIHENEGVIAEAANQIGKALRAVDRIGNVDIVEIPVEQSVVILGSDSCAEAAAREVSSLGLNAIHIATNCGTAGDTSEQNEYVSDISGSVGTFEVTLSTGTNGSKRSRVISCGAVIDVREQVKVRIDGTESPVTMPLELLEEGARSLPRVFRERNVVILLDRYVEETKASTLKACTVAASIQREGEYQVHVLLRHARVASVEIGEAYDRAREAGVAFLKYDGEIEISNDNGNSSVEISCFDSVLKTGVTLSCDVVAMSRHGESNEVSRIFANNLHFFPSRSRIPGYFLAGPATGQFYEPQANEEAVVAALEAHRILARGKLEVEQSGPIIDEEKCAICLTCIRTCPHDAMRIDSEKNIAENVQRACRRCGICIGACPARAITLPGYSEDVLFAFLD